MAEKAIGALIALLVVGLVLLIGPVLVGPFVDQADDAAGGSALTLEHARIDSGVGEYAVSADNELGRNETVYLTRGYAVELTGADDSFVESQTSFDVASDDTWTACTWAEVDAASSGENMTALSVNGRVLIQFNGSQSNWSVWYFDEGSRNSFRANVSAPDQPGNLTSVCAWHNSTHLSIFRNNTQGDIVNTSVDSSIEDADVNSTNFHGVLEETRLFDDALNNSQRQAVVDQPVEPLTNATRTARLMYDESQGSTTFIIFADVNADVSNATWVDGFAAVEVSEGSDYNWEEDGPRIEILAGGELADAPIAYADYDSESQGVKFGEDFADVIDLAAAVLLILVAGLLLMVLRDLSN